jgi:hypothetical protein
MGIGNSPSFSVISWQTMHKKIRPQICLAETKNLNKRIFKQTFLLGKKLCSCGFEELLSSQKYLVRKLQICKSQKLLVHKSQTRKLTYLRKVRYPHKFVSSQICGFAICEIYFRTAHLLNRHSPSVSNDMIIFYESPYLLLSLYRVAAINPEFFSSYLQMTQHS